MSDGKIVYTLKGGVGYDAPWIVISGDTVAEADANLAAVTELSLGNVQAAAALFQGAAAAAVLTTPQAPTTPAPSQPATTGGAEVKTCAHGPRKRATGTSARGPWVGWFCALPKGTQGACKAEFE